MGRFSESTEESLRITKGAKQGQRGTETQAEQQLCGGQGLSLQSKPNCLYSGFGMHHRLPRFFEVSFYIYKNML